MKLGELFVELGTKGNTKELEKTLKQLKEAEKKTAAQIKLNKDLAKATTDEEKTLIKKNYAQKQEISTTEKLINKNKERNKTIAAGAKNFLSFISAVSLAIGVLDRFINASAKSNQSILTLSQSSGVSIESINKYASAARSLNYNVSRESVAQMFQSLSQKLFNLSIGEDEGIVKGLSLLQSFGGKGFNPINKSPEQVLEDLRAGITNLTDFQAGQVLSQFGIGPELLPMLRMSSKEFAGVKNRFLSEGQMKEEQSRALLLQEQRDKIAKVLEDLSIEVIPPLTNILQELTPYIKTTAEKLSLILNKINEYLGGGDLPSDIPKELKSGIEEARKKVALQDAALAGVGATILKSKLPPQIKGAAIAALSAASKGAHTAEQMVEDKYLKKYSNTYKKNANNVTQTFNTTINTTQPADNVMMDEYQRAIQRGHSNGNFIKLYE